MALQPTPNQQIDRQTTTPFLLRLYYRSNAFHSPHEFTQVPPPNSLQQSSLQIYTWPTCTLSELTSLLTSALPNLLPSPAVGTRIGYRLLFPDTRSIGNGPGRDDGPGKWVSRELGSVVIGGGHSSDEDAQDVSSSLEGDSNKTLADARFVIGDYISCAILPPLPDGGVAPLPALDRGGGRSLGARDSGRGGYGGGGRMENGFGGGGYRGGGFRGSSGYGGRGGGREGFDRGFVPTGEWRRGERIPDGPAGGRDGGGSYGRGRGRGRPY